MKQDRFLTGILIGIGLLIAAALVIFFARQDKQTYAPDDTPDGVVHNYVLALINKDYQKAYGYLADLENKPTLEEFRQSFIVGRLTPSSAGIRIGKSEITADDATVEISMIYNGGDPFASESNPAGAAQLVRQNGAWKISSMPAYTLWDYSWYQAPPK
ncbi:MAG TPA: hypothetical protein VHM28_04780 [Anaerolineales bacterium]|nr:hypothetical protein [Anaerolineales bacterium]